MNYPNYEIADGSADKIATISKWLDDSNGHKHPEAVTWGRLSKGAEEQGEVISEYILVTGQNPRKRDQPGSMSKVVKESLDLAMTALGNVEHLTGNKGDSLRLLGQHIQDMFTRAGLDTANVQKDAVAEAFARAEANQRPRSAGV